MKSGKCRNVRNVRGRPAWFPSLQWSRLNRAYLVCPPCLHLITFDITMMITMTMRSHLAMRLMMTPIWLVTLWWLHFWWWQKVTMTTRMQVMSRRNIQELGGAEQRRFQYFQSICNLPAYSYPFYLHFFMVNLVILVSRRSSRGGSNIPDQFVTSAGSFQPTALCHTAGKYI